MAGGNVDGGDMTMCYSSYGGNAGTWFQLPRFSWPTAEFQAGINNQNGVIIYIGYDNPLIVSGTVYSGLSRPCLRLAAVTDGTSNTMMYSERAHGKFNATDQVCWNWWCSGNFGDTSFCTMYPINPFNKDANSSDHRQRRRRFGHVRLGRVELPSRRGEFRCSATARSSSSRTSISCWPINPSDAASQRGHARRGRLRVSDRPGDPTRRLSDALDRRGRRGRQLRPVLIDPGAATLLERPPGDGGFARGPWKKVAANRSDEEVGPTGDRPHLLVECLFLKPRSVGRSWRRQPRDHGTPPHPRHIISPSPPRPGDRGRGGGGLKGRGGFAGSSPSKGLRPPATSHRPVMGSDHPSGQNLSGMACPVSLTRFEQDLFSRPSDAAEHATGSAAGPWPDMPAHELRRVLVLRTVADPDLWGHVRFGQDILRTGSIIQADTYSYRTAGQLWINHEWLAEVIFAGLYDRFGPTGLIVSKS